MSGCWELESLMSRCWELKWACALNVVLVSLWGQPCSDILARWLCSLKFICQYIYIGKSCQSLGEFTLEDFHSGIDPSFLKIIRSFNFLLDQMPYKYVLWTWPFRKIHFRLSVCTSVQFMRGWRAKKEFGSTGQSFLQQQYLQDLVFSQNKVFSVKFFQSIFLHVCLWIHQQMHVAFPPLSLEAEMNICLQRLPLKSAWRSAKFPITWWSFWCPAWDTSKKVLILKWQ